MNYKSQLKRKGGGKMPQNAKEIKNTLGGKAFGLLWLEEKVHGTAFKVPPFVIIPVSACVLSKNNLQEASMHVAQKALISLSKKYPRRRKETMLAVRSGAPTSLPGLMDTDLWVEPSVEKTASCISNIWESYYNLPKEIQGKTPGTAVVIQEMVSPIPNRRIKAGVIFPIFSGDKLKLKFQYVNQIGEGIVGGKEKESGQIILNLKKLQEIAGNWVKEFGTPPEMEVVQVEPFYRNTFIVQIRDYKLLPEEYERFLEYCILHGWHSSVTMASTSIVYKPTKQCIIKGEGSGSCIGYLGESSLQSSLDYIFVCKSGISTDLISVVEDPHCKGLIFEQGALHCHGVVLFRGYQKAYARIPNILEHMHSEISTSDLESPFLLQKGSLYTEWEEVEGKSLEDNEAFHTSVIKSSEIATNDTNESLLSTLINPNSMNYSKTILAYLHDGIYSLSSFYGYKLFILSNNNKIYLPDIKRFYLYMLGWSILASLGELRHFHSQVKATARDKVQKWLSQNIIPLKTKKVKLTQDTFKIIKELTDGSLATGREMAYGTLLFKFDMIKDGAKRTKLRKMEFLMATTSALFSISGWSSSYGGPKWAQIADLAVKLLRLLELEEIPVDKLVALLNMGEALEHNNNIFFNKFVDVSLFKKAMDNFNCHIEKFQEDVSQYYHKNISTQP